MYGSQFDGNAAFCGGGFMPSQATQFADPSFAPSKNRDSSGLVPLTLKQVNEALMVSSEQMNLVVDSADVSNVTIVGLVSNKVEGVTDVRFTLDDGTGRIDVQRWVNEAYDTRETEEIKDGMYLRIHANLRGFQGKRQLVAFATRPITDFNELTFHFMECIYVHFHNTRLRAASVPADGPMMSSVNGTPFRGYQGTPQNHFPGQFGDTKDVHSMLLNYLQQNGDTEKGLHINMLVQYLNLPLETIKTTIKVLEEEGQVYTTIDDYHYKSTTNG